MRIHIIRVALSSLLSASLLISPSLVSADQPIVIAKLTNLNGSVMVNDGVRYQPAKPGQTLPIGTKIMVPQGGKANLVFSNGCVKPIQQNSILTINSLNNVPSNTKDCASSFVQERAYQVATTGNVPPPSAAGGGGAIGGALLGIVAVAGAIAVDSGDDNNNRPASGI